MLQNFKFLEDTSVQSGQHDYEERHLFWPESRAHLRGLQVFSLAEIHLIWKAKNIKIFTLGQLATDCSKFLPSFLSHPFHCVNDRGIFVIDILFFHGKGTMSWEDVALNC